MKYIVYIIFSITIFSSLQSCGLPYCKKTQFDKNDLEWMSAYEINDTVLFTSTSDVDTFIVTSKTINNPRNTFIFDLEQGGSWLEGNNEYKANADYEFKLYHNGSIYRCAFLISKESSDLNAFYRISFAGNYIPSYLKNFRFNEFNINDKIYSDCIYLKSTLFHPALHQSVLNIDYLIWSKSKGLIEYKLKNGNIYKLHKLL